MDIERLKHKTGVIIDGNAFLYRTYHVLKHRGNDEPTPGLIAYSFISQIRNLQSKLSIFNPVMYIIWDGKDSRLTRQDIFPAYKLNGPEPPKLVIDTRYMLMHEFQKICSRLNISIDGVEADDLMYLLARKDSLHSVIKEWIICTRDEDLMQALDPDGVVKYYNPYTKKLWSYDDFIEHYTFIPEFLVMYKALVGDTADNWKGVPGIGEKTAKKWLLPHNEVEELFADIAEKLKTPEKCQIFMQGLGLCELPLPTVSTHDWTTYLEDRLYAKVLSDWSSLHEAFEIKATGKAQFLVGKI